MQEFEDQQNYVVVTWGLAVDGQAFLDDSKMLWVEPIEK